MQSVQMAVSELMSLPLVTVLPTARVREVLELAQQRNVHHFPIVEHDKLVGIVCTCDLQELGADESVLSVAWRHVVTLAPGSPVGDAARLMAIHGCGSIVVSDEAGVRGIVTREDLIRLDPELDKVLMEARCTACGARRHLRPGPAGQCLCQDCQSRALDGAGLEVGGGD